MPTVQIDPITRLEGHLKIEVDVETVGGKQQVVDARAGGTMFRGFERLLEGRPPGDAPHITARICGVCPVSHAYAAVLSLEASAKLTATANARRLRNLVLGANFVQSHVLHFYHLALLDYVAGPDSPPWQPSWSTDKRVTGAAAAPYIEHYLAALEQRRTAHEMAAVFGGRLPHPPTFVPGGITATPTAERIAAFRSHIAGLESFVNGPYQDDLTSLSSTYSDYYAIGRGYANLLAYGCFEQDNGALLFPRGRVTNGQGSVASVDASQILEEVTRSWYEGTTALHPSAGQTNPVHPKQNAYSWLKSPRYGTTPYEVGPLARVWVSGDYKNGVSALDRHWARWHECKKILAAMKTWLDQLQSGQSVYANYSAPDGSGAGLTEAPRGALGHWVRVAAGKIAAYQVITPTCWFASPRDAQGQRGPLEEALVGTPVLNTAQPNEVLRVVHSFDPCLACAVHVTRPSSRPRRVFSPS